MAGKARVHELAKELGVTSKQILAELSAAGEFVKSASSTIEGPVARRLREAHGGKPQQPKARADGKPARKAVKPVAGKKPVRLRQPAQSQINAICERYRVAAASVDPKNSVNEFYADCKTTYGLSRESVKRIIAADARRHPRLYLPLQIQRDHSAGVQPANLTKAATASREPWTSGPMPQNARADSEKSRANRPRIRTEGLPVLGVTVDVDGIASVIRDTTNEPREAIKARLQEILPTDSRDYGYLYWRFSAARRGTETGDGRATAAQDLALLAGVIDIEKHLVRVLEQAQGSIHEDSDLAKRALENKFDHLISDDEDLSGLGDLGSVQSRRASARLDFLRRAIVLTVACPSNDERLWDMLTDLHSRPLTGTAPELRRVNQRLADFTASTERLLVSDDDALSQFFRRSRAELLALRDGRYDFLMPFRESEASRQTPAELAFELLPPGEQTQKFLDDIRKSGRYLGHHIDERRLDVLELLQKHFTPARCRLHKGSMTSNGVDNRYLVLAIKPISGASEDAVAISPLAGLHATYVVRREFTDADWPVIFAGPKPEARRRGARKLLFVGKGHADPYKDMRNKVINLLECDRGNFPKHHQAP